MAEIAARAALEQKKARTTEGEGERAYLVAIAEGQKAQATVLGQETTARPQMFQQALKAIGDLVRENPQLLVTAIGNAQKFVPSVVVGDSAGLEGAAAIFGHLSKKPQ